MAEIHLLIVADDPLARAGLSAILSEQEELVVIGQISAGDDLQENLDVYRPDLLLWDLGWEPEDPPFAGGDIPYPVLALLPNEDLAADLWAAGASGILFRSADVEQLQAAVQAVGQGMLVLDPLLADVLRPAARPELPPALEELTAREQEVLQLLAEGLTNRAIAQELGVSEHTVKFHVNAIMSKLSAQSRTEAVVRATRLGLLLL